VDLPSQSVKTDVTASLFSGHTVLTWSQTGSVPLSVLGAIQATGARALSLPREPTLVERSVCCNTAIVLGSAIAERMTEVLGVVKTLGAAGFASLVCLDGAAALALAIRCRFFLAGCADLLDSNEPGFAAGLDYRLRAALQAGADRAEQERLLDEAMHRLGIVGRSRQMRDVFREVVRLSGLSDLSLVITGETGTGKELMAQALYALDPRRRSGPFVALNCAAITPALAESELFGHRRGAFTGAESNRHGLIRSAHGGVLFLDEIGEMPQPLQAKLLRVLQEGRVLAVGEDREVPVSVRVVAATNRDLGRMVSEGTFRDDLFHRLNVLSLDIPPLRERRDDIRPLAGHFARKHRQLAGGVSDLTPEFLDAVSRLELKGNARQLENVIRWALVHHSGVGALSLGDLPPTVLSQVLDAEAGGAAVEPSSNSAGPGLAAHVLESSGWNLSRSLHQCERSILEAVLKETRGNHSRAARMLGITPRSVYNKVRRHGLA
jgi:two-component system nitrogen regulation response regulator GlnG